MKTLVSSDVLDQIRFLYIYHNVPLIELSKKFDVNVSTLSSRKSREKWDLFKEDMSGDNLLARHLDTYAFKGESVAFWSMMLERCSAKLEEVETVKEMKELGEARKMAEDRFALFTKVELMEREKEENNKAEGILEQLANL